MKIEYDRTPTHGVETLMYVGEAPGNEPAAPPWTNAAIAGVAVALGAMAFGFKREAPFVGITVFGLWLLKQGLKG
jgi:hypothetical protein